MLFSPLEIEWKNPSSDRSYVFLPKADGIDEEVLNESYRTEFNRIAEKVNSVKRLTKENFRICDVVGNCHLYIYLNGGVIGTPSRYGQMLKCDKSLVEYLFAYCVAKLNGGEIFLEDLHAKKRKKISLEELEEVMVSNFK